MQLVVLLCCQNQQITKCSFENPRWKNFLYGRTNKPTNATLDLHLPVFPLLDFMSACWTLFDQGLRSAVASAASVKQVECFAELCSPLRYVRMVRNLRLAVRWLLERTTIGYLALLRHDEVARTLEQVARLNLPAMGDPAKNWDGLAAWIAFSRLHSEGPYSRWSMG